MQLELRARGVRVTRALREHIEKRLHHALGRFNDQLQGIRVELTDINGPRGGEDVECRIQADVAGGGTLIIDELRACPFTAVARASDRIGHSARRRMGRIASRRRGR